jgi:ribonuclease HI
LFQTFLNDFRTKMLLDKTNGSINRYKSLLLFVDGGCEPRNPGGAATSGWVLYDSKDTNSSLAEQGEVVIDGGPLATNNYGEYNALILALDWLVKQKWQGDLTIKADSKLLIEQVSGRWKVKAEHLKPLREKICNFLLALNLHRIDENNPELPPCGKTPCHLMWIPRDSNQYANDLCRSAYVQYKSTSTNLT